MTNIYKLHSIAYQKYKLTVDEIEEFKESLNRLIGAINSHDSSEEHNKNIVNRFLKDNLYMEDRYEINTHDRIDTGIIDNSNLKVIIEYKATKNKNQMPTVDNLNKIALAEAMLYYIREKDRGNESITNIIITNSYEWFVFDSSEFRRLFYDNPRIKKVFDDKDKNSTTDNNSTKSIYDEFIKINKSEGLCENIKYSYFDIREINRDDEYQKLYKLLSPTNLLKLPFANDANTLNKKFYHELLHIIGLEETKEKSQKLIGRKSLESRENGSLLENTIIKLKSECDVDDDEELFDIALELNITWLNRILFLKLLEGKLIEIDPSIKKFLIYSDPIEGFAVLNTLFFEVLAKPLNDRASVMINDIVNIPYLNSSLFEVTALERKYQRISSLKDNLTLSIKPNSNLKNDPKYKSTKEINTLEYLLGFLDTYDFGSGGDKEKSNTRKDLINSAVLGLIFEKLNGYKDGSFFTPSFITEYMSRESIRKSVLDKFATSFDTVFDDFDSLVRYSNTNKHNTSFRGKANSIIDSITICDPAVGSGHFLVSALNELLLIKSKLGIIFEADYELEIENDELYLVNQHTSEEISYTLADKKSHKFQKILFEQKRNIIENQLFGVDINSKSTQITRLRLWIELLKSSYYDENNELTTLPNIDINIKTGNSLISKFDTQSKDNDKLPKELISKYKKAVKEYKETDNKKTKQTITQTIEEIKASFTQELKRESNEVIAFKKSLYEDSKKKKGYIPKYGFEGLSNEIIARVTNNEDILYGKITASLFGADLGLTKAQVKTREKNRQVELKKLLSQYETIKELESNEIYKDSFEWRFEFPEILDEDGEFVGFDIVIGNPPYIKEHTNKKAFDGLRKSQYYQGKMDLWYFFGCQSIDLIKENGYIGFIATNNWITNDGASKFRNKVLNDTKFLEFLDFGDFKVFEEAEIQTMIYIMQKSKINDVYSLNYSKVLNKKISNDEASDFLNKFISNDFIYFQSQIIKSQMIDSNIAFLDKTMFLLVNKIEQNKNFQLDGKNEIFSGIDFPQDIVNKNSKQILGNEFNVGDGIFVISEDEKNALNLTNLELNLIKPYFTTSELDRYYGSQKNKLWVIYTNSLYKDTKSMKNYPNLKKHLDKFNQIITSENKPYGLNRAREIENFQGVKIISKRKCPNKPVFTYTNFDTFFNRTFMIIKSERINLKYLTALFNSQLIAFWLKYKGKMQGDNYQIDKEPILNIPIKNIEDKAQKPFINLVNQILKLKKENKDTTKEESEIDNMVYKLYGLSDDEVAIVEGSLIL